VQFCRPLYFKQNNTSLIYKLIHFFPLILENSEGFYVFLSFTYLNQSFTPFLFSQLIIFIFSKRYKKSPKTKRTTMTQTKKIILLVGFFLPCISMLQAQKGTVASGGDAMGSGGSASYSIGQTDYITANGTGGTITQGLQQPYEIYVITGVETYGINLSLSVYPNPTTDMVTLSVKNTATEKMSYILSDVQGKIIRREKLTDNETSIFMADLRKSTYLVKVLNNNKEVKTFKIIKN
jgi:hypothetical protein